MTIADKDHQIERLKGKLASLKAKYDCLEQSYKRLTEWRKKQSKNKSGLVRQSLILTV